MEWDSEAERRLKKAPFFIRNVARKKVERAAQEQGRERITVEFMEKIKTQEMGR